MPDISIVIPCYNEEQNIEELYVRLVNTCKKISIQPKKIIFINDGSTDNSWQKILEISRRDTSVIGLNLSRNFGHQYAISAGLANAAADRILIIDADLQDPPELLIDMMNMMDNGYDVVYGKRNKRYGDSLFKKTTAKWFYIWLDYLSETKINRDTGDFRLINRKVLNAFNSMPEANKFIRGMISWVGFKQTAINYNREKRFKGEGNYTLRKMVTLALDAITGFSVKPLRLSFYFGFLFAFIGIIMLIYTLHSWLVNDVVTGWTSIVSIILIISSFQFIILGLIGEYLGRVFIESKHRPNYIISGVAKSGREVGYQQVP